MPVSKKYIKQIQDRAKKALNKTAVYGEDIDLNQFQKHIERGKIESLELLPELAKEAALMAGVDVEEKERSGSYVQMDHSVVYKRLSKLYEGKVELMSTNEAVEVYDWLEDYFWRIVQPDTDKYTAQVALNPTHGYFIRILPGQKLDYPLQTCLMIAEGYISQNVHNIVIVEEGAELHIITGCTLSKADAVGIHLGISEFYVKKGGKLFFTMIHNWAENFYVRPRTAVMVEEDGVYVNNYALLKPVKSIQSFPTVYLKGDRASARFNTVIYGLKDSYIDLGSKIIFEGKDTKGESLARTIADHKSVIYSRGDLIAKTQNYCMGRLDCRGIIFSNDASIYAIPQLISHGADRADLSHEASIGPISEEQVEYLMSRGMTKDEATSLITSGFLNLDIPFLPEIIDKHIKEVVQITSKESL
ncbi:SufB/SufD family protein [Thermodesulfovibrio yellowstonii]|uniref:SufB/SufD family protein n=1 Tax=Thermodesulfovibrio yellowstonii TaxID=28262 RepID=UPI000406D7AE|nr:SufD family Fe-S cluster assembly protein [Thermodesulfovibrio islandicus]